MTWKNCTTLTLVTAALLLLWISTALCASATLTPKGSDGAATVKPLVKSLTPANTANATKPTPAGAITPKPKVAPKPPVKAGSVVTPDKKTDAVKAPGKTPATGSAKLGNVDGSVIVRTEKRVYAAEEPVLVTVTVRGSGEGYAVHSLRGQPRNARNFDLSGGPFTFKVPLGVLPPGTYDYEAAARFADGSTNWVQRRFYVSEPIHASLLGPTDVRGRRNGNVTFDLVRTTTSPEHRRHHAYFYDYAGRQVAVVNFRQGSDRVGTSVTRRHPGTRTFPYTAKVCDADNVCSGLASHDVRFVENAVQGPRISQVSLPPSVNTTNGDAEIRYSLRIVPGDYPLYRYEINWRPGITRAYDIRNNQTVFDDVASFEQVSASEWHPRFRVGDNRGNWSQWFEAGVVSFNELGGPALTVGIDAPNIATLHHGVVTFDYTVSVGGSRIDEIEVLWNRGRLERLRAVNARQFSRTFRFEEPAYAGLRTIRLRVRARAAGQMWGDYVDREISVVHDAPSAAVRVLQGTVRRSRGDTTLVFQVTGSGENNLARLEYMAGHQGNTWHSRNLRPAPQVYEEVRLPIGDARHGTYVFRARLIDSRGTTSATVEVHYVIEN